MAAQPKISDLARKALAAHPELDTPTALAAHLRVQYPFVATANREGTRITCKRALDQAEAPAPQPEALPGKVSVEKVLNEDGTLLVTAGQIKTLPDFLRAAQVDLDEYQLVKHKINKWDVTSTRLGKPIVAENWQVTAEFKPVQHVTELCVTEIGKLLQRLSPVRPAGRPRAQGVVAEEGCLYELAIFDAHLGKLCDPDESGAGYDLDIACATFMAAVEKLLARAAGYQIERFLLPLGNDFFNSDSLYNATTAGTPQHEAARWRQVFVRGTALVVAVIERLRQVAPVEVIIVPGNHDKQRAFFLGEVIAGRYAHLPDEVRVNNDHKARKYFQWGQCGLMFTHGNDEKEGDLAQIFATENKRLWADTEYREIHCGHKHRKSDVRRTLRVEQEGREYMGAHVRFLRALSDTDDWHSQKGYIGNQRAAEGFMWNRVEGVIGNFSVNI